MLQRTHEIGYVLTALGIAGIIIALMTEQSDYDPVAFGIATFAILLAIVGISLVFKLPPNEKIATVSVDQTKKAGSA
jgi:hypothetical protein